MAKMIPFPAYHDFAPLDISYLFEDEKPAGKHGFLKASGKDFVFELQLDFEYEDGEYTLVKKDITEHLGDMKTALPKNV